MPGIAGILGRMPCADAKSALRRMVEVLDHEPFYVTGTWDDASMGLYLGWSAREDSFSDGMPICNEQGDVILVFSGEEFSDPGSARRLESRGHVLGPAAASYIVHLYEEDPSFAATLNGRFHGILIDRARHMAILFNDRYGMHRLYYRESKEGFYFAAEAKAVLAACPDLGSLDPRGLGEFVSCGCVLENRTVFQGVHVLPGAASWVLRNGCVEEKGRYFQPQEWEDQTALSPEAYRRTIRESFSHILPRYFSGRERVAGSLTGGLDTRMIMAWQKYAAGTFPCYTFGGMFRECQDVLIARRVAQVCGQSHQVIEVGDEFLSRFPEYAERSVYLTDGCVDVSRSADLFVNERARQIAPVRITGNYGGEILRRVRAFKPIELLKGLFQPEFVSNLQHARETYDTVIQGHPLSFALFRQGPWHFYGTLALEETQLSLRSPFLDNDFVKTVYRAPVSASEDNNVCLRLIADGNAALGRIRTDRGIGGSSGPLVTAASNLWLEFLFKAEYAYDYGMPQWLAQVDYWLSSLRLERLVLGRHKFYHFRVWYRDRLSAYLRDMLLDPRTLSRPYLERRKVETIVNAHLKGNRNYTSEIHKLLTLELVHRLFSDSQRTVPHTSH